MKPRLPTYRDFFPVGICCQICGCRTRIVDTRGRRDGTVWRRHECLSCRQRFTTRERIEYRKAS